MKMIKINMKPNRMQYMLAYIRNKSKPSMYMQNWSVALNTKIQVIMIIMTLNTLQCCNNNGKVSSIKSLLCDECVNVLFC